METKINMHNFSNLFTTLIYMLINLHIHRHSSKFNPHTTKSNPYRGTANFKELIGITVKDVRATPQRIAARTLHKYCNRSIYRI